jgi:hypothetical protein
MLTRMGFLGSSIALASTLSLAFACTSKSGADDEGSGGDSGSGANSSKAGSGGGSSGGNATAGSTAAGSTTGGSGGMTSSTPNCEGAEVAEGTCQMIDDFEDGDDQLWAVEGRGGKWYAFDDGTGTASPARDAFATSAAEDRPTSAVHSTGEGFSDYGGGVGFGLSGCYDASAYTGVSFWAKADTSVLATIRFSVATSDTRPEAQGGTCTGTGCGDNYGIAIELTDEWKQYEIKWTDMFQVNWGKKFAFNNHNLLGVDFTAYSDTKPFGWDFWVDDIAFTGGESNPECAPGGGGGGGAPNGSGGEPGAGGGG